MAAEKTKIFKNMKTNEKMFFRPFRKKKTTTIQLRSHLGSCIIVFLFSKTEKEPGNSFLIPT